MPFVVLPTANFSLSLSYTNPTGQVQLEQSSVVTSTWTKTVELTTKQRPISIVFGASGYTNGTNGEVTINLFENDILKASNVGTIGASGIQGVGLLLLPTIMYVKN